MIYDFRLCVRKDGTYYGTAGQCRKGTETDAPEEETTRERVFGSNNFVHLFGKKRETANKLLNKLSDEEFARVTSAASRMISEKISPPVGRMSSDQILALQKRSKNLIELYASPKTFIATLKPASQEEAEAFYSILTPALKSKMPAAIVKGVSENSGLSKEQVKIAMAKRWLEQDGKDPFTGLPVNFRETSMDHVRSFDELGKKADNMNNLLWVHRDVNQSKLSSSIPDWLKNNVMKITPEEAQIRYIAALKNLSSKSDLKQRAREDIKILKEQSDRLIKEYGKYSYYLTKELGFPVVFKQPSATRYRNVGIDGGVKTSSGKSTLTAEILKRYPFWSNAERVKAIALVKSAIPSLERGDPKPTVLQKLYEQLSDLSAAPIQIYSVKTTKSQKKDRLDDLLAEIRGS
jgi:hypothetical protein